MSAQITKSRSVPLRHLAGTVDKTAVFMIRNKTVSKEIIISKDIRIIISCDFNKKVTFFNFKIGKERLFIYMTQQCVITPDLFISLV